MGGHMTITFQLNGITKNVKIRSGDRLSTILTQEHPPIKSLIPDCLSGHCGKCLVIMDKRLVYSCLVPAFRARDAEITTIEGLSDSDDIRDIQKGFQEAHCHPCNFCKNAKTLVIWDLLNRIALPNESQIEESLSVVSCSCTDPVSLKKAVFLAADLKNRRKYHRADK